MRNVFVLALVVLSCVLVSCAAPGVGGQASSGGPEQVSHLTFVLNTVMFVLIGWWTYYLLIVRPTSEKQGSHKKFIDGIKKNDDVVTSGGIIGRVVTVKSNIVTIEIAQNVRVRVNSESIHPIVGVESKVALAESKPTSTKMQQTKK